MKFGIPQAIGIIVLFLPLYGFAFLCGLTIYLNITNNSATFNIEIQNDYFKDDLHEFLKQNSETHNLKTYKVFIYKHNNDSIEFCIVESYIFIFSTNMISIDSPKYTYEKESREFNNYFNSTGCTNTG